MRKIMAAVITGILFIAEIILLKVYDVAPIGAGGTYVGFAGINGKVHEALGVHMTWYTITEYLGYGALAICAFFALVGLIQLISRRSLFRVDREILSLGGLFAADIVFYVLFEKFIVNYRPIFIGGSTEAEASFPSSHTVLIVTVMIAIVIISEHYMSQGLASLVSVICVLVSAVTVGGRLYSGAHWLTDIVGGILLAATLLFIFDAVIEAGEYDAEGFYEPDEDEEYDDEDEEGYDEEDEEYDDEEEYYGEEEETVYYEDDEEYDDPQPEYRKPEPVYRRPAPARVKPAPEEVDYSERYKLREAETDAVSLEDLFDEEPPEEDPPEEKPYNNWEEPEDYEAYERMESPDGSEDDDGYRPRH